MSEGKRIKEVELIDAGIKKVAENGLEIKPPGKRPDNLARNKEHAKPGDNARYLRHSIAMWNLPVLDISDPEAVRERITWYFTHCMENDMKPTVTGLSLSLGVNKDVLNDWASGRMRGATHGEMVKQAKMVIEDQMNSYMENGKINPVAGIFLMKNHFGYRDQQEHVLTPNMSMGEAVDADEMRTKYLDNVKTDPDE